MRYVFTYVPLCFSCLDESKGFDYAASHLSYSVNFDKVCLTVSIHCIFFSRNRVNEMESTLLFIFNEKQRLR